MIPDLNIGKNIVELRKYLNFNQDEFAEKLKVSKATVSLWENNRKYPSKKNVARISSVFNIKLHDLFDTEFSKTLIGQSQFRFRPRIIEIKPGIELHIETEKLSKEQLSSIEKAINLMKVFFAE